MKFGLNYVF